MPKFHKILREVFGLDEFRPGQTEIINGVLKHQESLIVMPTGAGKSLCFQIPAVALGGVCLVISPLIALMQDQVSALRKRQIESACLHAGLANFEKEEILRRVVNSESYILYVSPERVGQEKFFNFLKKLNLTLIVIDEAHCIIEWGAEFRPDYRRLILMRQNFKARMIALTASATPQMRKEIIHHLGFKAPFQKCFGFFRSNIFCQVQICLDTKSKLEIILAAIEKIKEGRVLIYCGTRIQCEALSRRLKEENHIADFYHAGMSSEQRTLIQRQMNESTLKILCCTCAFGMGMDYPDIRLVIHFEVPSSLEELYQEIGRGGRDQKPARALSLFSEQDLVNRLSQIQKQGLEKREVTRRLKALSQLVTYLKRPACRHRMIAEYFGDFDQFKKLKSCGTCDFCCVSDKTDRTTRIPQIYDIGLRNRLRKLPLPRSVT